MRFKLLILALFAFAIVGCSGHQAMPSPDVGSGGHVSPHIRQTGEVPVQWRRFHSALQYSTNYPQLVAGSDGNVWYFDYYNSLLMKMRMTGSTQSFPLLNNGSGGISPTAIAVGVTDHKFYTGSQQTSVIDVADTSGNVTTYTIPSSDFIAYDGMAQGPDGNVWFAENAHVGKITPAGTITEYAYADAGNQNYYGNVSRGPDNNVWATEYYASVVDKINPSTGAMTSYNLTGCNPSGIISAGGFLWVNCGYNLAKVTTGGVATMYPTGYGISQNGAALAVGPDGNPWFTTGSDNKIGEFDPVENSLTFYYPPQTYSTGYALTTGPDGNVWVLDSARLMDVYIINVISVSPSAITFTGGGQNQTIVVTEAGTSAWTASSSNTAVATVAQGSPASNFTVTSVATGRTKIIVTDAIGNSFAVVVTVH